MCYVRLYNYNWIKVNNCCLFLVSWFDCLWADLPDTVGGHVVDNAVLSCVGVVVAPMA